MAEIEGTSGGHLVQPPAQAGTLKAHCPGPCAPPGQPVQVLGHSHNKERFPPVWRDPPGMRMRKAPSLQSRLQLWALNSVVESLVKNKGITFLGLKCNR